MTVAETPIRYIPCVVGCCIWRCTELFQISYKTPNKRCSEVLSMN